MNTHKCDEKCKGRKSSVVCFICKGNFFMKCFGLDQSLHTKLSAADSFIKFVCGKCQNKKRTSVSTPASERSNDIHLLNNNIASLMDRLSRLEPGASTQNLTTVVPDDEPHNVPDENKSQSNTTIENIYKLMLKASDKLNHLHTTEMERNNLAAISTLIDNKFKEMSHTLQQPTSAYNDIFENSKIENWPMCPETTSNALFTPNRPSLLIKQSVDNDILDILKNSDKTTWETLDVIRKDINKQTNVISELKEQLTELNADFKEQTIERVIRNTHLTSPLVDAIINGNDFSNNHTTDKPSENPIRVNSPTLRSESDPSLNSTTIQNDFNLTSIQTDFDTRATTTSSEAEGDRNTTSPSAELEREVIGVLSQLDSAKSQHCTQTKTKHNFNSNFNRELYVTKFETHISIDSIKNYLKSQGIVNLDSIKIHRLVKKDQDLSQLSYISFKIDTNDVIAEKLLTNDFWPSGCRIGNFVRKNPQNLNYKCSNLLNESVNLARCSGDLTNGPGSRNFQY